MGLLAKLLNTEVHLFPAIIGESEIGTEDREEMERLVQLRVLENVSASQYCWCQNCEQESVRIHYVRTGRAWTQCSMEEDAERFYFDPRELKQWMLNTQFLLSLFLQAIGIKNPKVDETVGGLLWNLGPNSINRAGYQLFFSRNLNELSDEAIQAIANSQHPAIFYTGQPRNTLPPHILTVPLANCIKEVDKDGVRINKDILEQYFPVGSYAKLSATGVQKTKGISDLVFPEQVQWEKVTVKVKDGMKEIDIIYDSQHIRNAGYVELEFYTGKTQQKQNREWQFLITLSALIATDRSQATARNMAEALTQQEEGKNISADNVHGIKRKLDKSLQRIFQKDDNESAFYDYHEKGYYEPKFTLVASPELRHEELRPQGVSFDDEIAVRQ